MDQVAAFIDAFVASHRRARYHALGGVPTAKLCHDLERDLDRRFVVEVPSTAREIVQPLLEALTDRRECVCVARWPECQGAAVPIGQAIMAPCDTLCLIEPGRIAYYLSEWSGAGGPTYLLLRDNRDRLDALAAVEAVAAERQRRRRRRR